MPPEPRLERDDGIRKIDLTPEIKERLRREEQERAIQLQYPMPEYNQPGTLAVKV